MMDLKSPLMLVEVDCLPSTVDSKKCMSKKNLLAFLSIVSLVVITSGERFSFKLMVDRMESYRYFIAQTVTAMYVPSLFAVVAYKSNQKHHLNEEILDFPKRKIFVMAFFDILQTMMVILPAGKVPAPLTVTLLQSVLPFTVLFSALIWKRNYLPIQLLGALLILCGGIITLLPVFSGVFSNDIIHREAGWNSLVYFFSAVPASLAILYKEKAIRHHPMDIFYLNAWTCFYQFILGIFLGPLIVDFPGFYLNQRLDGFNCFLRGKHAESVFDHCEHGLLIVVVYVVCGCTMNMIILYLMRSVRSFATYSSITLSVAFSFATMEVYQYMIPSSLIHSPLVCDLIGMVILLVGLVLYREKKEPETEVLTLSAAEMEAASLLEDNDKMISRYS